MVSQEARLKKDIQTGLQQEHWGAEISSCPFVAPESVRLKLRKKKECEGDKPNLTEELLCIAIAVITLKMYLLENAYPFWSPLGKSCQVSLTPNIIPRCEKSKSFQILNQVKRGILVFPGISFLKTFISNLAPEGQVVLDMGAFLVSAHDFYSSFTHGFWHSITVQENKILGPKTFWCNISLMALTPSFKKWTPFPPNYLIIM